MPFDGPGLQGAGSMGRVGGESAGDGGKGHQPPFAAELLKSAPVGLVGLDGVGGLGATEIAFRFGLVGCQGVRSVQKFRKGVQAFEFTGKD